MKDLDYQQKLQQELEQKDQRILKKAFKKHGLTFTDKDEELVDRLYGPREDEEALIDFEVWLDGYCETLKAHAKLQHLRPPRKTKSKSPRGPHRGTFGRRMQIVDFVLKKQLSKGNKSIKWQRMADDWELAHPDDKMTKVQLEYAFNDAVRDEHVQREYSDKFALLITQAISKQTAMNKTCSMEEFYDVIRTVYGELADGKEGEDVFYKYLLNDKQRIKVFHDVAEANAYNEGVFKEREAQR